MKESLTPTTIGAHRTTVTGTRIESHKVTLPDMETPFPGGSPIGITADSTLYRADSTLITADNG